MILRQLGDEWIEEGRVGKERGREALRSEGIEIILLNSRWENGFPDPFTHSRSLFPSASSPIIEPCMTVHYSIVRCLVLFQPLLMVVAYPHTHAHPRSPTCKQNIAHCHYLSPSGSCFSKVQYQFHNPEGSTLGQAPK